MLIVSCYRFGKPFVNGYLLQMFTINKQITDNFTYYLVAFFLLATVLRLPLRVRLLFLVLWPRTGNPLR